MDPSANHHDMKPSEADPEAGASGSADLSVWLIWAVIMLLAVAVLPFAVRSQDVVRAIARMCGFELG